MKIGKRFECHTFEGLYRIYEYKLDRSIEEAVIDHIHSVNGLDETWQEWSLFYQCMIQRGHLRFLNENR